VRGRVYIVGAGPGDPGLLTIRAWRVLRRADVVFYDRLVPPAVLERSAPRARRVCAEKAHPMDLSDLVERMVREARAGRVVVRLKGGDPFVFGRGAEEAEALIRAGVPCQVIPGVTSAVAVPGAAGIPVTHRGVARGFVVETAHRASGEAPVLAAIPPEPGDAGGRHRVGDDAGRARVGGAPGADCRGGSNRGPRGTGRPGCRPCRFAPGTPEDSALPALSPGRTPRLCPLAQTDKILPTPLAKAGR